MKDLFLLEVEIQKLQSDVNRCPDSLKPTIWSDIQLLKDVIDYCNNRS